MEVKTPSEWSQILDIVIADPDGWRQGSDADRDWFRPITKEEFMRKVAISTCKWPQNLL